MPVKVLFKRLFVSLLSLTDSELQEPWDTIGYSGINMKTIMILRHGKSDWNADFRSDHDRPLAPRGQKASGLIGEFLRKGNLIPEKVLVSTATRARETILLAMQFGKWECPVDERNAMYMASPEQVLTIIQKQSDSINRLMLVGHNPTWENLVSLLVGGGRFRMPTASLARIRVPVEQWQKVSEGYGLLDFLITPKLLNAGSSG